MLKKIIADLRTPYVTSADSFIILMIMLINGGSVIMAAEMNTAVSAAALVIGSVFLSIVHTLQCENKKKNYLRGYAFCIIPSEILIVIVMLGYSMDTAVICLAVSAALTAVYLIVFFALSHRCRLRKTNCLCGIHTIAAVCLTPCIISFFTHLTNNTPLLEQPSAPIASEADYSVSPITSDEWDDMDFDRKFNYLSEILRAEACALKMTETPVLNTVLYPAPLLGTYNYCADTVTINAEHLLTSNGKKVITSLGHELYHRYEYIITEDPTRNFTGVSQERIDEYRYDFENPADSTFDWESYYNMSIEVDARTIGEQIADKYFI